MKLSGIRISSVGLFLALFSGILFGAVKVLNARADPTTWYQIYLPITMNNYKAPPPVTISHYINWDQSDLTYQNFYDMGETLGQSVPSGFWGYVVLHFGEPWREGSTYKVLDYKYVTISVTDVEYFVKGYLSGFYNNSPADAFIIVAPGITNQGPYFSYSSDPQGFGRAWGTMITNLVTWIDRPPSYAGKVAVAGGLDNELSWNNASKSLSWKNGYLESELYTMIQSLLRFLGKLLSGGAVLIFVGLIILLAVKSFPAPQAGISAYPAPGDTEPVPSTLSPEILCDQWFSYRKGQPEDQRKMIEEDYKNCVNARKTPSPVGVDKSLPSAPPIGEYSSPFIRRAAGIGTIIETNFSPLSSNYRIKNQWVADLEGIHMTVYAGGRQSDSTSGDALINDLSWPGVLVVVSSNASGKTLSEKGGVFLTPQNVGPVRIVDASGTNLTLVAKDGSSFNFDVADLKFLSQEAGSLVSRSIGAGILIESGNTPYHLDGFVFVNQWSYNTESIGTITLLAGNEQSDPHKGVLIVLVSSIGDSSKVLEGVAYLTNLEDGALRIVTDEGEKLTLVSDSGLVYEFDLATRQFVSIPSGSDAISVLPLVTASSDSSPGPLSVTNTPTLTPTPRPTRTPLPTYNPYP